MPPSILDEPLILTVHGIVDWTTKADCNLAATPAGLGEEATPQQTGDTNRLRNSRNVSRRREDPSRLKRRAAEVLIEEGRFVLESLDPAERREGFDNFATFLPIRGMLYEGTFHIPV